MTLESRAPSAPAQPFEFEPLEYAVRYRRALVQEFSPFLRGAVLEVGAGVGHITALLQQLSSVGRVVALEPSAEFGPRLRSVLPETSIVHGTIDDIKEDTWDGIVCVNVLEHIEQDARELREYCSRLRQRQGHLCLFVPARQELYAPIDRDFGHYRRYHRPDLARKLSDAGFEIVRLCYFNWVGYFIWWLNFKVMKNRRFDRGKIILFDRVIFPLVHTTESKLLRPPFGQSLLAIARAGR